MTTKTLDWSGNEFALPNPRFLSRSWRLKKNLFGDHTKVLNGYSATSVMYGQDSINADVTTLGKAFYAGYYNGTYANLTSYFNRYPGNTPILSVTPDGTHGARCIDCEPGDATPAQAAQFVLRNLPLTPIGGRHDSGVPMVYCSAGDAQAVIDEVAALGIGRHQWDLWTAHWIGLHVCGPYTCGYPLADGTQYASNNNYDSDMFYSYVFGPVLNPTFPLKQGDLDVTSEGPVRVMQARINAWGHLLKTKLLVVDGSFGPATAIAVGAAQIYFGERGVPASTCDQRLYDDLLKSPVAPPKPPPVKPPLPVSQPVTQLKVNAAGAHSVSFEFRVDHTLPHPTDFQVKVVKDNNGKFGETLYTRVIHYALTGTYGEQYGSLEPDTKYILIVRTMSHGHAASAWSEAPFKTAK